MKTVSVCVCDALQQLKPQLKTKVVWNLHDDIAKVIERGLARGFDFNGKKKMMLKIMAIWGEENDNRFNEFVKSLVSKYMPIGS
jgi:hypothetical protein